MANNRQKERDFWLPPWMWWAGAIVGGLAVASFVMVVMLYAAGYWRKEGADVLSTDFHTLYTDHELATLTGSALPDADYHVASWGGRNEYGAAAPRTIAGIEVTISLTNGTRPDADGNLHFQTATSGTLHDAIKIDSIQDIYSYGNIILPSVSPKCIYYDLAPALCLDYTSFFGIDILRVGSNANASTEAYTLTSVEASWMVLQQAGDRSATDPFYDVVTMAARYFPGNSTFGKGFTVLGPVFATNFIPISDESIKNVTGTWDEDDASYWYDQLRLLPIKNFTFQEDYLELVGMTAEAETFGFIAQDVATVCEGCVTSSFLDMGEEFEIDSKLSIKQDELVVLMVNAIQVMASYIDDLEARIEVLETPPE